MNQKPTYEELEQRVKELEKEAVQLRKSQDFRTLVENSPDLIARFDRDLCLVYVNPAILRATGLSFDDYVGKSNRDLGMPEDVLGLWDSSIKSVFETGQKKEIEFSYQTSYGERSYQSLFVPEFSGDGRVETVLGNTRDITERKQVEKKIYHQTSVLKGINRIFQEALSETTEETLGEICLSVAEEVTGSKIGFIGEIGTDGLLQDVAISSLGWKACRMIDQSGHRRPPGEFQIHGIYGRVIKDGKGFFTNDPAIHPDRIGFPNGHPPLTAFLGVPLIFDKRNIGMIAVGNRDGGYSGEEQESLESLAPVIAEALMRKRAEKALRESKALYRSLIETMFDGLGVQDETGRVTFANDRLCQMLGYSLDEIIGRPVTDFFDEFPREVFQKRRSDRLEGGLKPYEMVLVKKDGEKIWTYISPKVIFGEDNQFKVSFAIISDITEYKQIEEALMESEEKYRTLVEGVPDLIYSYSAIRGGIYYSPKVQSILGYSPSYLLQNPFLWHDSIHPDDLNRVDAVIQDFQDGKPFEIEYRIKDAAGNWHWFLDRSIGRKQENGEIAILGTATDITERKQAEETLWESEKKYRNLIESLQEGIWVIDKDSNTTFVNVPMATMLGYAVEEMLGRHLFSFMDDRGVEIAKQHLEHRKQGIKEQHEFEFVRKDGDRIFTLIETKPFFDDNGN